MPLLPGRGGACRPPPPGMGTNKSGIEPDRRGGPPAPRLAPGWRSPPVPWARSHHPSLRWSWLPQPLLIAARLASPESRGLSVRLSWLRMRGTPSLWSQSAGGGGQSSCPGDPGSIPWRRARQGQLHRQPVAHVGTGRWCCPMLRGPLTCPLPLSSPCAEASDGYGLRASLRALPGHSFLGTVGWQISVESAWPWPGLVCQLWSPSQPSAGPRAVLGWAPDPGKHGSLGPSWGRHCQPRAQARLRAPGQQFHRPQLESTRSLVAGSLGLDGYPGLVAHPGGGEALLPCG